jgi:hypothetical protein
MITLIFWTHLTCCVITSKSAAHETWWTWQTLWTSEERKKIRCSCWDSNAGHFTDWGRRSHIGHPCECQSRGHPQVPVPAARPIRRVGAYLLSGQSDGRLAGAGSLVPCRRWRMWRRQASPCLSEWVSCLSSCLLCHHSAFLRRKIQSWQEGRCSLAPTTVFVPSFKSLIS